MVKRPSPYPTYFPSRPHYFPRQIIAADGMRHNQTRDSFLANLIEFGASHRYRWWKYSALIPVHSHSFRAH